MAQVWCEPDAGVEAVDLCPEGRCPRGSCHVLDAEDGDDRPVSLVHEDSEALRRMAVFDVLVNNADRKGGHVLAMADGHRYGVDHGVCFHEDHKLRTVLWGWAGEPLRAGGPRRRRGVQPAAARGRAASTPCSASCSPRTRSPRCDAAAAACSPKGRMPSPAVTGRRSRGRRSDRLSRSSDDPTHRTAHLAAGRSVGFAPCVRGRRCPFRRSSDSDGPPPCASTTRPPDRWTTTGPLAGPALRLRHHAVRRDAPGPRRDLRRLRPAQPRLARRRARGALRAERHRRRRPAARAGAARRGGLAGARRPGDRAVPRRHGGAAGPAARRLRRRRRVDPAGRRDGPAARPRSGTPTRSTATGTSRCTPTRASATVSEPARAEMLALFAERGGDPDRPGQEAPARLPAVARRAAGRAGVGLAPGPRTARVARRVQRDRAQPPRGGLRRPGRRHATWSSRTTR